MKKHRNKSVNNRCTGENNRHDNSGRSASPKRQQHAEGSYCADNARE